MCVLVHVIDTIWRKRHMIDMQGDGWDAPVHYATGGSARGEHTPTCHSELMTKIYVVTKMAVRARTDRPWRERQVGDMGDIGLASGPR